MTTNALPPPDPAAVARAAQALHDVVEGRAALVIGAGAGMGVDSGLPDFRGPEGFWRAYPPYRHLGLRFEELADARWFDEDPTLAWGFYGHRRNLYRRTRPHAGFHILRRWARAAAGAFVFTSNVDGQFQRAGFDDEQICEVHGAIGVEQCTAHCGIGVFAAGADVELDEESFRARAPFPTCPSCGALSRPNILMFGDGDWDDVRATRQEARLGAFLDTHAGRPVVVVECGAGTAIPSVRRFSERLLRARSTSTIVVRCNLREPEGPEGVIGLASGARAALEAIDDALGTPTT